MLSTNVGHANATKSIPRPRPVAPLNRMRHQKKRSLKFLEASCCRGKRRTENIRWLFWTVGRRSWKTGSRKKESLNIRMVSILTLAVVTILVYPLELGVTANSNFVGDECPEGGTKWRSLAERGDARAQFKLGVCYESDQHDPAEAIRWYRRAAAQGHQVAMWNLYDMYRRHAGIPHGRQAAYDWLRQAAENGDAVAQYLVAEASIYAIDEPPNLVKAYMWLTLSAKQGFPVAMHERELLDRQLLPSQVAKALQLANEWNPQQ